MSHHDCSRNDGMSPAQILLLSVLIVGLAILAYLYVRWVIETREGKVFSAIAGAMLSVLWLFGALDEAAPRAVAASVPVRAATTSIPPREAPEMSPPGAARSEVFASGPGWQSSASMTVLGPPEFRSEWRRGRDGLELCTTISGQTRCTAMPR